MKQLKAKLSSAKSQLIENQQWVISLQEQIIDNKDKQLDAVQTVVKSSVQSNLKEQFKSYREAAAGNVMVCQADSLTDGKVCCPGGGSKQKRHHIWSTGAEEREC